MTDTALHPTPSDRQAVLEQIRAVGLRLRGPAAIAAAFGVLATIVIATEVVRAGTVIAFRPQHFVLPGVVGLLLPIAVWRREDRFGPGFLWTLPVDRRRAALAKVLAGWLWLLAMVGVFILWLLGLALLSGANLGGEEIVRVLSSSSAARVADPTPLTTVDWSPEPWLWIVPITAATAMYLLGSAFALGVEHPWRWAIGFVLGMLAMSAAGQIGGIEWLAESPGRLADGLWRAAYGLDMLLTAQTESYRIEVLLTSGDTMIAWRQVASGIGEWLRATLLWSAIGAAGLWAASRRHRELRAR